jgi:beta-lactamase regulating signal transducer with metallopeptidase domain
MNVQELEVVWRAAILVVPLAIVVAVLCRFLPARPTTRHTLWLTVLIVLVTVPLVPSAPAPDMAVVSSRLVSMLTAEGDDQAGTTATEGSADQSPPVKPTTVSEISASAADLPSTSLEPRATHRSNAAHEASAAYPPFPRATIVLPPAVPTSPPTGGDRTRRPAVDATVRADTSTQRSRRGPYPGITGTAPTSSSRVGLETDEDAAVPAASMPTSAPVFDPEARPPSMRDAVDPVTTDRSDSGRMRPTDARAAEPSTLELWGVWLRTLRDELIRVPPVPASIWLAGCGCIAVLTVLRIAIAQQRRRHAHPAPEHVTALVHEIAHDLRLRRVPGVWMTAARVSPMITCCRRARLILPTELWSQLDHAGRRAIVCHELAHLKRRDHWVCWLALVVGCIYWWHPIVWWARRRIREEADLCCDVWVTALMPRARRAYATALLETKRFTTLPPPPEPAVAIGTAVLPAQRFRRRLIMVMSQQLKPRLTWGGIVLAGTLAAGSWFAAPSLACPPDEKAPPAAKPVVQPPKAPAPPAVFVSDRHEPKKKAVKRAEHELQALIEALNADDMSLEQRLAVIERKVDVMLDLLEERLAGLDVDAKQIDQLMSQVRPLARDAPRLIAEAVEQPAIREYLVALGAMGEQHRVPLILGTAADSAPAAPKKVLTKTYELPNGRLEALTELMSRDDVPVLIRPGENGITVIGTLDQQMVFQAFVDLVTSDDELQKKYELPKGRLEALSEFMIRSDVPVLISPQDDGIVVHGNRLQQTIFGAFVDMITNDARMEEIRGYQGQAGSPAPPATELARTYEQRARQQQAMSHELRAQSEMRRQQLKKLEQEYKAIEREIDKLDEMADKLDAKVDELEEKAEAAKGEQRLDLIRKANEVALEAQRVMNRQRLLMVKLETIEMNADEIEEQLELIEDQMERVADQMEEREVADRAR